MAKQSPAVEKGFRLKKKKLWAILVFNTKRGGSGRSYGHILLGGGAATLLELNIFLMFLHLPQQRIQCLFNRKLTRLPLPSVFSQGEYLPFLSFDIPYRLTHHMIHQPYILHLLPLLAKILEKVLKYLEKVQPRKQFFTSADLIQFPEIKFARNLAEFTHSSRSPFKNHRKT